MNIGLMGLGTVGMGVYEILNVRSAERNEIKRYRITKVLVRSLEKERPSFVDKALLTTDEADILDEAAIDIVVCVMGDAQREFDYIKRALNGGKSVVTANKQVVSEHIDELMKLARENNVNFMFGASVGGGIPIISSICEIIRFNKITQIQGILNGTTNYILTKLIKEKREFSDILSEAQKKGFAEADPSADVDGYDIMRKIIILSSIAFKKVICENEVHIRGVGNISLEDVTISEGFGYTVKYIAQGLLNNNRYSISVTPVLVRKDLVIGNVNEEYNVILVKGDIIGKLCFMGKGAGKDATANAVVSDIIKAATNDGTYNNLKFNANVSSYGIEGINNEYFIRVNIEDFTAFSTALDLIANVIKRNNMRYTNGNLYLLSENIASSDMKELSERLSAACGDVFYARIENNIL